MNVVLTYIVTGLEIFVAGVVSLAVMGALGISAAAFLYRAIASYAMLLVCALYGTIASIVLRLVGDYRITQWTVARAFKYTMLLATGVQFEIVSGAEYLLERPAVFIANHQTALDVLLIGEVMPKFCSITSKVSLKSVPVLGWFMALSGTVFIDRGNRSTALKAFEGAASEMRRHKQSVLIFPEGTRSDAKEPTLLGFKKGAFHLAVQAKAPIVPVVSACYYGVLSTSEWRFRRGTIPLVVLPPIYTDKLDASDVDKLTQDTREAMLKALVKLTESPIGQQAFKPVPPPPPPAHTPVAYQTNSASKMKSR